MSQSKLWEILYFNCIVSFCFPALLSVLQIPNRRKSPSGGIIDTDKAATESYENDDNKLESFA